MLVLGKIGGKTGTGGPRSCDEVMSCWLKLKLTVVDFISPIPHPPYQLYRKYSTTLGVAVMVIWVQLTLTLISHFLFY